MKDENQTNNNQVIEIIDSKLDSLTRIQEEARILKERYIKTEGKTWTPAILSAELSFQTTHLLNSVIRNANADKSIPLGPVPGIDKGLEDEVSDVIFNLVNLANLRGINIKDSIQKAYDMDFGNLVDANQLFIKAANIVIQSGELWDAIFRSESYKFMSKEVYENEEYINRVFGSVVICTLLISHELKIDIYKAFRDMFKDSTNSLNNMGVDEV